MKNPYSILGVSKTATQAEIKKAFYALARKYHPDHNKDKDADVKFKEINNAYEILGDEKKRSDYDQNFGGFSDKSSFKSGSRPNYRNSYQENSNKKYGTHSQNEWEEFFKMYQNFERINRELEKEYYRKKREQEQEDEKFYQSHRTFYQYNGKIFNNEREVNRSKQMGDSNIIQILIIVFVLIYLWNYNFTKKNLEEYKEKARKRIDEVD